MKQLTPQDFAQRVLEDLVAQHMLGELKPQTDLFRAQQLCAQRDHKGRTVWIRDSDVQRALVAMVRLGELATEDGRRFTLPPAEPLPVTCDVVDGRLSNVKAQRVA